MSDAEALAGFVDKWRARWPEWRVAEVFAPPAQRHAALARFALVLELTEAAWGGSDPRPGEAKLAWWAEELQGWAQGRRRHPLGQVLQRQRAPWAALGAALPALRAARERVADTDEALALLRPFAAAVAAIDAVLFEADEMPAATIALELVAERALAHGEAAVPLQALAQHGASPGAVRAWARELQSRWPEAALGTRVQRLRAALLRARLARLAAGHPPPAALTQWAALFAAWRGARG